MIWVGYCSLASQKKNGPCKVPRTGRLDLSKFLTYFASGLAPKVQSRMLFRPNSTTCNRNPKLLELELHIRNRTLLVQELHIRRHKHCR